MGNVEMVSTTVYAVIFGAIILGVVWFALSHIPLRLATVGGAQLAPTEEQGRVYAYKSMWSGLFALLISVLATYKTFQPSYSYQSAVDAGTEEIRSKLETHKPLTDRKAPDEVSVKVDSRVNGGSVTYYSEIDIPSTKFFIDTQGQKAAAFELSGYPIGGCLVSSVPEGVEILHKSSEVFKKVGATWTSVDARKRISVVGQADGHTSRMRPYRGTFRRIDDLEYFHLDNPHPLHDSFIPGVTIMTNERFALLRAYDAYRIMRQDFQEGEEVVFHLYTNVVPEKGSASRKVIVELTVDDAYPPDYDDCNRLQKLMLYFTAGLAVK